VRASGKKSDEYFLKASKGNPEISEAQFSKLLSSLPGHDLGKEQVGLVFRELGPYGLRNAGFVKAVQEFCTCLKEIAITPDFDLGSGLPVRKLAEKEVFEVLEGPQEDAETKVQRVRGRALRDGAAGWVTVQGNQGTPFLKDVEKPHYSCKAEVPLEGDFKGGGADGLLRKLNVGELFLAEEAPVEEEETGLRRIKATTLKDSMTGWLTLKGNAGTTYAEISTKHYVILRTVPLTKKFPTADRGEEVRTLAKGEALLALEGPKQETSTAETRVKVKAISDNVEGWVTLKPTALAAWSSFYKCKIATPVHDTIASEGATTVRQTVVGETFEIMEGPTVEGKDLRMRARSEKDGTVGWVTIKTGDGKRMFE